MLQIGGLVALAVVVVVVVALTLRGGGDDDPTDTSAEARSSKGAEYAQITLPDDGPLAVSIFGDSLVAGSYAKQPEDRFTELVQQGMAAGYPVEVDVDGEAGAEPELRMNDVPTGMDVVIVAFGTDSATFPQTDFVDTFPALVDAVEAASPDAQIVCLEPFVDPDEDAELVEAVRDACNDTDSETVVPVADLATVARNHAEEGTAIAPTGYEVSERDTAYPGSEGHAAIAAAVLERLDVTG